MAPKAIRMASVAPPAAAFFSMGAPAMDLIATNEKNVFSADDEKVVWFCKFKLYAFTLPPKINVKWFSPDGNVYKEDRAKIYWTVEGARAELSIKETEVAKMQGRWSMEAYWKGALADRQDFYIGEPEQEEAMGMD